MDEFNKDRNPFDEQNQTPDPYNTQNDRNYDPYNTQQQQQNPYGEQNQGYNNQNVRGGYEQNPNPYSQQQNPYQQTQNPYQQNGGYTYNQQNIPQQGYYMNPQGYQPYPRPQSAGVATVLGISSICTGILDFIIYPLFLVPVIGIILGIDNKSKPMSHLGNGVPVQSGHVAIPGSKNPDHIRDNFDIFDFALTDEEMAEIAKLDKGVPCTTALWCLSRTCNIKEGLPMPGVGHAAERNASCQKRKRLSSGLPPEPLRSY